MSIFNVLLIEKIFEVWIGIQYLQNETLNYKVIFLCGVICGGVSALSSFLAIIFQNMKPLKLVKL